ncbi:MAG: hypothetical protein ACP5IZ_11505 [Thermoprotei archaeon]|jgi:hypothetical protein
MWTVSLLLGSNLFPLIPRTYQRRIWGLFFDRINKIIKDCNTDWLSLYNSLLNALSKIARTSFLSSTSVAC